MEKADRTASDVFRLEVPLDASAVEDMEGGQAVKVVARDARGTLHSQTVDVGRKGEAVAAFEFDEFPGAVRIWVGPADAGDDEMEGLQTITVDISPRRWSGPALSVPPVKIAPFYWHWWLTWCQTFTIHGVLLCPDGHPVPGATVCAYDVDWWWWWSSQDLAGCATTDQNGAFTIKFKWCCRWWPWWWWKRRFWQLDPLLVDRIQPVIGHDPSLGPLLAPTQQPSLKDFESLLADHRDLKAPLPATPDPTALSLVREQLLERLPVAPELEQLRIWPWWPWHPWSDCAPDIVFRATQDCHGAGGVILEETIWDARWNVTSPLTVTLYANDQACCLPDDVPCGGECLAITNVCSDIVDNIGGNTTAPAAPIGYQSPGNGDRPYGGQVGIYGTSQCMEDVDYYEFEWSTAPGGPWNAMPWAAVASINHSYADFTNFPDIDWGTPTFPPTLISGQLVYETLQHYEATHGWTPYHLWVGTTKDWLMAWATATFPDGAYYLRLKGWDITAAGDLTNPRVLPICNSSVDNYVVVRIDNRVVTTGPVDPRGHPCGPGTVHACTDEPEAAIVAVNIVHADGAETPVTPCGNVQVELGDWLQIDFAAHDPDGHLGHYTLGAHYAENEYTNLLALVSYGGSLTPSPVAPGWAPPAAQVGPTYGDARAAGAVSPTWHGGTMRLTVPATGPEDEAAFPETCCYQLQLRAHKRTIVDCNYSYYGHSNYTEYIFNVSVG